MNGLKIFIFHVALLYLTFPLFAQDKIILNGTVMNENGEPLPFAGVSISNGMTGTISNQEGKFTLALMVFQKKDTLCISHIGYKSFCVAISELLGKPVNSITLSEDVITMSEVVIQGRSVPTAEEIISQVRKNLKKNYPTTPYKLKSFYRQSKLVNGKYVSLQEAAVDVYAKNHNKSNKKFTDEILMVNEFRKSHDYFDKEFDALLDPPMKINPIRGVLLQNGVKYVNHSNILLRKKGYQLDSIVNWGGKDHYVISLPKPNSLTLYVDVETYAVRKFKTTSDLSQTQTIIDRVHQDSLKSKLRAVSFSMEFKEIKGKFYPFFMEFIIHASIENLSQEVNVYESVGTQQLLVTDIQTRNVVLPTLKEQTENRGFDNLNLKYNANFWNNYNIIQLTPTEERLLNDLQKELSLDEQFKDSSINPVVEPKTQLSPKELKEDFTKFRKIMEEVHTGLYTYIDRKKWNLLSDSLYQSLNEPKSWDEFYKLISYSIARIGNGHTEALLPSWWHDKKRAVFPLRVQYIQGKLIVEESFDPGLPVSRGCEIVSINGRLVEDIRGQIWPLLSADGFRETYKFKWLGLVYERHLAFILDDPHDYVIEYINLDGENKIARTIGLRTSLKSYYDALMSKGISENNGHKLEINKKKGYVWLEIQDSSTLMDSLEGYFKTIKESKVQNLVIDLRTHSGLLEDCDNSMLYAYFVDRPFRFFEYMRVKSNNYQLFDKDFTYAPYATSLKEIKEEYFDKLKRTADGYFSWEEEPCSGLNEPGRYLFDGHVYILVDGFTFSANADFVSKMIQLKNVTIVGEETGGAKDSFISGFMPSLILPHSQIKIRIPTWQSLICCPKSEELTGHGVIPDHEVVQNVEDFIKEKDTVKEYVMNLLQK